MHKINKVLLSVVIAFTLAGNCAPQLKPKVLLTKTLKGHTASVDCLAFSPDGNLLASGSQSSMLLDEKGKLEIIIWDTRTNKLLKHLSGHKAGIKSVCFDKTGTRIISADRSGEIKIWETKRFNEIKSISGIGSLGTISISPNNKYILGTFEIASEVCAWDLKTGILVTTLKVGKDLGSLDISPDGKEIALSYYKKLQIWNLKTSKVLLSVDNQEEFGFQMAYSHDGKKLAVGLGSGDINIYDPKTLKVVAILKGHFKPVLSVSFNKTDNYLLSGSSDQMAKVWNIKTNKILKSLVNIHRGTVSAVRFNPVSNTFATTGDDGTVQMWKLVTPL